MSSGPGERRRQAATLVASALAGGDCIADADALRAGGTPSVLGCRSKRRPPSGTFLRSFRWGHVRQLDRLSRKLLARAWAAGAGPGAAPFTIDLDSTICETYGLAKEGARHHGYTGVRGYHPLLAVAAGTGDVLMARLREGRANTARGPPTSCVRRWRGSRRRGERAAHGARRQRLLQPRRRAACRAGCPLLNHDPPDGMRRRSPPQGGYSPPETAASMGQERLCGALTRLGDRPCSRIPQRRGALRARTGQGSPSASTWATATPTSTPSAPAGRWYGTARPHHDGSAGHGADRPPPIAGRARGGAALAVAEPPHGGPRPRGGRRQPSPGRADRPQPAQDRPARRRVAGAAGARPGVARPDPPPQRGEPARPRRGARPRRAGRTRTLLINHVRGAVKACGAALPSCTAEAFHRKTADHIPDGLRPALLPLVEAVGELTARIAAAGREIEALCEAHSETAALRQVTGVGPITALTFVLTVEDPSRFPKNREVGAYLGLVPRQRESGERAPQLGIAKSGDAGLRRLLVQAAHYIGPFGPDTDLRRWGERYAGTGARKEARGRGCARRLAVRCSRCGRQARSTSRCETPWPARPRSGRRRRRRRRERRREQARPSHDELRGRLRTGKTPSANEASHVMPNTPTAIGCLSHPRTSVSWQRPFLERQDARHRAHCGAG